MEVAWALTQTLALALVYPISRGWASTVHVEHELACDVETAWKLFQDPDSVKKWWGPHRFSCPDARVDLKAGGKFAWAMKEDNGPTTWSVGTFTDVRPRERIQAMMAFGDVGGENPLPGSQAPVPGAWPDWVELLIEFSGGASGGDAAVPQLTKIKITETGIPLIMKPFAGLGWKQQFEKMEAILRAA